MKIEFGDIKIGPVARQHIEECLNNNYVTQGPKVELFEQKWAEICGVPYACAVNSGTSALMAMFMALYEFGAKPGDEIICPALSFVSSWTSIIATGFKPVWVDVRRDTLGINTDLIEDKITDRTVAILGVSLMGRPYTMDRVDDICDKYDLLHYTDACESHGAKFKGYTQESWSDATCYSFYAAHCAFSVEGGIVTTKDPYFLRLLKMARNHGREPGCDMTDFQHLTYGLNLRMTDIHASIGLESLDAYHVNWHTRKNNWNYLQYELSEFEGKHYLLCNENPIRVISPHAFSMVFLDKKTLDKVKLALKDAGIHYKRNFGSPNQHKVFRTLGFPIVHCPEADYVGDMGIHIGVHQYLTHPDLEYIVKTIKGVL